MRNISIFFFLIFIYIFIYIELIFFFFFFENKLAYSYIFNAILNYFFFVTGTRITERILGRAERVTLSYIPRARIKRSTRRRWERRMRDDTPVRRVTTQLLWKATSLSPYSVSRIYPGIKLMGFMHQLYIKSSKGIPSCLHSTFNNKMPRIMITR